MALAAAPLCSSVNGGPGFGFSKVNYSHFHNQGHCFSRQVEYPCFIFLNDKIGVDYVFVLVLVLNRRR